jgi:hypothetical protein
MKMLASLNSMLSAAPALRVSNTRGAHGDVDEEFEDHKADDVVRPRRVAKLRKEVVVSPDSAVFSSPAKTMTYAWLSCIRYLLLCMSTEPLVDRRLSQDFDGSPTDFWSGEPYLRSQGL